jgi:solute carrier family 25 carnitine/acylcarnitine transporter 20/29
MNEIPTVTPPTNTFLWFFAKDLIAGTAGGMAGIVAGQPADTIKVRQQTYVSSSSGNPLPSSFSMARTMLQKEGPLSFFRGMVAPLIANAPINALIFTVYGGIVRHIEDDGNVALVYDEGDVIPEPKKASLVEQLMAGAAGGLTQCVVACPSELIKIQQQTYPAATPPSTLSLAKLRVAQSGFRVGLFQGWNATMLRDVPAFGLYFYSYAWFKETFESIVIAPGVRSDIKTVNSGSWLVDTLPTFMAGGMAGVTSWAFTMPCDVIKSTIQAMPATSSAADRRWMHVAKIGVERNGTAYFFRGAGPAILRAFPVSAVVFTVYEAVMGVLDKYDVEEYA